MFTSAGTVGTTENATPAIVYTAAATDADGDQLTYSISGGADASRFSITTAGALSFVAPPDFEVPADADQNNDYLVGISASDGKTSTVLSLVVTVADDPRVTFTNLTAGVAPPSDIFLSGSGTQTFLSYTQRQGEVGTYGSSGGRTRFHTYDRVGLQPGGGLLGFVDRVTPSDINGPFYALATNTEGDLEVRRDTSACGSNACFPGSDVILVIPRTEFANGNYGGFFERGPDGFLYIGIGDGGGAADQTNKAQDPNSLLGKILRIDISRDDFPSEPLRDYAIPAGNPFAGGGGRPEIWALGFKNPNRGDFDPATGNLYVSDRSEAGTVQEINLLRPTDGGGNFGWPYRQGTQIRITGGPASLLNPVIQYTGNGVTAGNVYRGTNRSFSNHFFFGDSDGRLFSVPVSLLAQGSTVPETSLIVRSVPATQSRVISGFAIGENIFVAASGIAYRLDPL